MTDLHTGATRRKPPCQEHTNVRGLKGIRRLRSSPTLGFHRVKFRIGKDGEAHLESACQRKGTHKAHLEFGNVNSARQSPVFTHRQHNDQQPSPLSIHNNAMSEPYDPYLPRGGSSSYPSGEPPRGQGNAKTAAIQAQIDDTVGIMRENITKVAERGERLDSLQDKTDNLAVSAQGFRRGANKVRKNMWWKDMKMRIIIGVGIAILLIIIIVPIVKLAK